MIRWRPLVWVGVPLLIFIWLAGTNGPGLLLGLGVVVAGTAFVLWRKQRSTMRSVLGELGPSEKSSIQTRVPCLVAGHKWIAAAEAPDPRAARDVSAISYAGDGEDTVALVCRHCGHRKVVSVEDFRRFISGPSATARGSIPDRQGSLRNAGPGQRADARTSTAPPGAARPHRSARLIRSRACRLGTGVRAANPGAVTQATAKNTRMAMVADNQLCA